MTTDQENLLAIIREYYGRVVWTHKVHEKDRELNSKRAKRDKWVNVILMALTTTGVLVSIPLGTIWITIVSAILAFISTAFAVYQVSFIPETYAYKHRQSAKDLLVERDKLVLLIEKAMASKADIVSLRKDFELVVERIDQIYAAAPDTSIEAYKIASTALKKNEEFTFSPNEIDVLLPSQLRLNQE